ncbi:MAG TPA: S9 family peptidase [Thermoanaerobaculia bacterium]|nr:S9 family peptidase [Thermoanaerobaculia bacterium]
MENRRSVKQLAAILILLACPALAQDLERTVTTMAKIGFANSPSFSADGKRIAFLTNLSGSPQVWSVPADGGYPEQITTFDDPVTAIDWSPSGEWIALQVAPGGGLNSQIYLIHPDGTGLRRITEGGKENNWLGKWTPDSKALAISSNRRSPDAMDNWLVDLTTGKMALIAQNTGIGRVIDISRDGKYALVERLRSRGDNDVYRVSLAEPKQEVLLTKHTPPALFGDGRFGATSDVVYLSGNPGRDLEAFGAVKINGDAAGPFTVLASRDDAELDSVELTHGASRAILSWNRAGRNEISFFNFSSMKETPVPRLAGDIAGGFTFAPNDTFFAFSMSGATAPSDIWTMSTLSFDLRQLTRSPHAGVSLSQLVRPELYTYLAQDGVHLSGWLYRPKNVQPPYPTVFSFHGGPEGQERPSFNSTYQALLTSGIAVFAPNVRGSSGFGKRFVNLDNGALRVNGVRDIKDSVDALVKEGLADPKRLAIMGGSYGGYMVMAGVTEFPDLFAAGADLFGVVNFDTFFKHTEPWMAAISTVEYGDPATQADMLRSLSPINKLDRVKTPLIVLHGANDTNVPVVEAEQIVNTLRQRNVPVEYVLFPDEGHGWRKTNNRIKSTVSIVRFFSERLK